MSELSSELPASRSVHGKQRRRPRHCHHPGARKLMRLDPCRPNLIIPLHAPQRTASQQNARYLKHSSRTMDGRHRDTGLHQSDANQVATGSPGPVGLCCLLVEHT